MIRLTLQASETERSSCASKMRKITYIKINKNPLLKMGLILNFERFISILQVSDRK